MALSSTRLDLSKRLTPYSINSAAKIEFSILSQGHWYEALRMAENVICEKSDAIKYAKIAKSEQEEKIAYQELNLQSYSPLEQISILADISRWAIDVEKHNRLIEDAQFEMDTALRLKRQILRLYPESATMSYEQMQRDASYQAYLETRAEQLTLAIAGRMYNLPPEVFQFLLNKDGTGDRLTSMLTEKLDRLHESINSFSRVLERPALSSLKEDGDRIGKSKA